MTNTPLPLPVQSGSAVSTHGERAASGKRYHDFDALRAFAMLLGIVMHGLLSFVVLPIWPAQDIHQNSAAYGFFQHAIHGFRMPLFFLISGLFTAMMWRKRGTKGLVAHRARRILVPLIMGTILVWPPMIGVSIWGRLAKQKQSLIRAERNQTGPAAALDLWAAAREGDVDSLQQAIDGGANVNQRDLLRVAPLEWAAIYDRVEAIAFLVDHGARVGDQNHAGSTPLHSAAFFGRTAAARKLVELGADPNIRNNMGDTPLGSAGMDMGLVQFIAGLIGLQIDSEKVAAGKRETASFLEELAQTDSSDNARAAESDGPSKERQETAGGGAAGQGKDTAEALFGIYLAATFLPVFHHLWFLYYLLWLVGIFLVAVWIRGLVPGLRIPSWMITAPWCFLWLVPVTLLPQLFMTQSFGPDTAAGLLPWPPKLIYYLIFFGFGALCFGRPEFEEKAGNHWPILFVAALPVLLLGIHFFERRAEDPTAHAAVSFLAVIYAWLMIFGMIGFFRRFFFTENRKIRYLSDASYWLYLAHLPLIIGLQVWVSNWDLPHFLKFLLVCTLTFAILMVMYATVIRYTFVGTMLNGKKTRSEPLPAGS